jgi:hypothetical protein
MAGTYDITAEEGATWSEVWTWLDVNGLPVNLTGYSAAMDWRTPAGGPGLSFSTALGNIALGGAQGTITPTASAAQTAALPAGLLLYDLFLTSPGGVVTRLLAGNVKVVAKVTQ